MRGASRERPLVCVCIPTYNAAATIAGTLDSIVSQTYAPLAVIVVDNASTDGTSDIVRRYVRRYPAISHHRYRRNIGAEGNFNRCLRLARGEYTCIYHSDDEYDRSIIEQQVAFLEANPAAAAVFTAATIVDGRGRVIGRRTIPHGWAGRKPLLVGFDELFPAILRHGNFLMTPSAMVRTTVYRKLVRRWNGAEYASSADLDVWLRIALRWRVGMINQQLMRYRVSPASFSYRASRNDATRDDLFLVLDDYLSRYRDRVGRRGADNYRLLNLHREIVRSSSLLIHDRPREALALARGVFSLRNVLGSFSSAARARVLAAGYIICLLSLLPIGRDVRDVLGRLRWGAHDD